MAGELENNDTVSEEKMSDAEYITMLESGLDVKLAEIEAKQAVVILIVGFTAACALFYIILAYGSN